VDFALEQYINKADIASNDLVNTYTDFNMDNIHFVEELMSYGVLFLGAIFICMMISDNYDKNKNRRLVAFERMCLEVLENIKL